MYLEDVLNISIIYDDNIKDNINDIKTIIINNYDLFTKIMGNNKFINLSSINYDNSLNIDNFYEYFNYIVNSIYNTEEVEKSFKDINVIISFYIEYLIRMNNDSDTYFQPNPELTLEMVETVLGYNYFANKRDFNGFIDFLKYRDNEDKIFNWIKNKYRFDVYNRLLDMTVNSLKKQEFDFLENISNIVNIMLEQIIDDVTNQDYEIIDELPKINNEIIDKYFNMFLKYIKAPKSWTNTYNELKENNLIIYEYNTDDTKTRCFIDRDDKLKIYIANDGTIKTFCSLVHEFIHYISMKKKVDVKQIAISEFPSIFFEKISFRFLRNQGYSTAIINKIMDERIDNNCDIYTELSSLFYDMSRYINKGNITKESKVEFWTNQYKILKNAKDTMIKSYIDNGISLTQEEINSLNIINDDFDMNQAVLEDCDILINSIIKDGLLIVNGFQYLLDTYLAECIINKSTNNNLNFDKMIWVTNNLNNLSLKDIVTMFDIKELYNDINKSKTKKRKKY